MTLVRHGLGFFPTPVTSLERLSGVLGGPRLLIKRDDQTGLAIGGNKTRKLEFLLGDALSKGADSIVTAGAAQSNHCRQTAAAAAMVGLDCHLLLGGTPSSSMNGNLLLDHLFGATIHWRGLQRKGEDISLLCEELEAAGKRPCAIPYGGSNAIGASGFVHAIEELMKQVPRLPYVPTHIVFASSSGGTHAGLMAGIRMRNLQLAVVGISVDKEQSSELPFRERIRVLATQTAQLSGRSLEFDPGEIVLREEFTGDGYGVVGTLERNAISTLARYEGILLDPVYTGRAMGALMQLISEGEFTRRDTVLFWHTGGTPALFACDQLLREA